MNPSNQRIIVPNGQVATASLINFSSCHTLRFEIVLDLSYDDDMAQAPEKLKALVQAIDGGLADPGVDVWLTDFGDSSINMVARVWCERADFLTVRHAVIVALQKECRDLGYSIPFPQRDVHVQGANL